MIYVTHEKNKPSPNESFKKSFDFLTKFANCLGLLPITGSSATNMKFEWKSWKTIYAFTSTVIFITNTVICMINWTSVRFSFRVLARQLNQINAFASLILYLRLAKKWPKFSKLWNEVDLRMSTAYGYPKSLDFRLRLTSVSALVLCLGEYLLLLTYQIMYISRHNRFSLENYYRLAYREWFSVVSFNGFTAFFVTATSLIGHLIWSFNDLFIVAVSSALALRFKQITNRLHLDEKKSNSNNYWIEIRADYDRLVHLSRKLEKYFTHIVLLSYSANIFFLLIQISNVIGHLNYKVQILYYTYSFSFLILRVVAVSLYGAWIIDESKEPANILHCVPSATYNLEIRRLLLQISFNDVGITGNRMFKVTRGLLLHIAGAIVTYELVIVQFNDSEGLH